MESPIFSGLPYLWGGSPAGGGLQTVTLGGYTYTFNLAPVPQGSGQTIFNAEDQQYAGYEHLIIHNLDVQNGFPGYGSLDEALSQGQSSASPSQDQSTAQSYAKTQIRLPITVSIPTNQTCKSATMISAPSIISPSTMPSPTRTLTPSPAPTVAPTAVPTPVPTSSAGLSYVAPSGGVFVGYP